MKSTDEIKKIAVAALLEEADAVKAISRFINDDFVKAVEFIYQSKGRVVVTGIGKSAIVANKMVATLNSTGTPAIFMHAADAIHGDLGIIQKDDIVICVSKSGNTPEIKVLVPLLKQAGNKLIAIVGSVDSYLAQQSDFVLNCTVDKEACPNNLAPTSSTTAQMALGDALAICLLECREFTANDFARYHPGGSLGKKLYLRVSDIYVQNQKPIVGPADDIRTVILEISSKRLGVTAVVENNKLLGVITDGDLRRMLEKHPDISKLKAKDIMSINPKTIAPVDFAVNAVKIMKQYSITQLAVAHEGIYDGFIHMHDLVREGVV